MPMGRTAWLLFATRGVITLVVTWFQASVARMRSVTQTESQLMCI